ncbi:hypothetical protein A3Q56_03467 [Intoshia linei]|uniref:A to I editase domain-containing protein n=1 Tax=Intoshia linei TaxID=1819745 RepID=A0A177B545_9BILA|nr:hypothetical protein A3Q56_03467 [Intoshia linei]
MNVQEDFIKLNNEDNINELYFVEQRLESEIAVTNVDDFYIATITYNGEEYRENASTPYIAKSNLCSKLYNIMKKREIKPMKKSEIVEIKPMKKIKRRNGKSLQELYTDKGPLMTMGEFCPGHLTEFSEFGTGCLSFKCTINYKKCSFQGYGISKKEAKRNASRLCLSQFYPQMFPKVERMYTSESSINTTLYNTDGDEYKSLSTKIYNLVTEKYYAICSQVERNSHNVISGIILSKKDCKSLKLLCVTSGSKTISGASIGNNGKKVVDGHAEILARRCFIRFILNKIYTLIQKNQNSFTDSEKTINDDVIMWNFEKKKFEILPNINIHLYISCAPCGDGRLFSLNSNKETLRKTHGVLRVKIEDGMGTVLPGDISLQTMDGILGGDRILTMSCSDKILLWNAVGMQGALLSQLIEPFYLDTIVVAKQFNEFHLQRALNGRLDGMKSDVPYKTNAVNIQ